MINNMVVLKGKVEEPKDIFEVFQRISKKEQEFTYEQLITYLNNFKKEYAKEVISNIEIFKNQ